MFLPTDIHPWGDARRHETDFIMQSPTTGEVAGLLLWARRGSVNPEPDAYSNSEVVRILIVRFSERFRFAKQAYIVEVDIRSKLSSDLISELEPSTDVGDTRTNLLFGHIARKDIYFAIR